MKPKPHIYKRDGRWRMTSGGGVAAINNVWAYKFVARLNAS